ncbi:hypothetical protein HYH02_000082 [Chlamydomonas schloesseri]|uniref:Uncharacterized protein n=1 Tax=Chlamydomonas schloesseri TaxID=2026947 RepID=A0A836B7S3_9CHLO|nr:hypothetical protein HYH02_000082 [Chlamydomonas schloesseri]|eukprot:KAG2449978.1 hypothetical protein HYH02_000082 [Chlamydomonas schloesseri]
MWYLMGGASKPRPKTENAPAVLRITNLLGYLFLILVNVLSSTGAFGDTNAVVSGRYPTPLTPAGWAFSIWGVIFALEGLGVVHQVLNSGYREGGWKTNVVLRVGYGWQAGWLFQDLWQIIFVQQSVVGMYFSFLCLAGALASFVVTMGRLNGTAEDLRMRGYPGTPALAYIFYKLPTSINAAWLSVATCLGLLIIPVAHGVGQDRLVVPAALLAAAVTAGGVWRMISHRDAAYGLTLVWALSAVAADQSGRVPRAVKVLAIVCLVVLALFVVYALVRTRREASQLDSLGSMNSLDVGREDSSSGGGDGGRAAGFGGGGGGFGGAGVVKGLSMGMGGHGVARSGSGDGHGGFYSDSTHLLSHAYHPGEQGHAGVGAYGSSASANGSGSGHRGTAAAASYGTARAVLYGAVDAGTRAGAGVNTARMPPPDSPADALAGGGGYGRRNSQDRSGSGSEAAAGREAGSFTFAAVGGGAGAPAGGGGGGGGFRAAPSPLGLGAGGGGGVAGGRAPVPGGILSVPGGSGPVDGAQAAFGGGSSGVGYGGAAVVAGSGIGGEAGLGGAAAHVWGAAAAPLVAGQLQPAALRQAGESGDVVVTASGGGSASSSGVGSQLVTVGSLAGGVAPAEAPGPALLAAPVGAATRTAASPPRSRSPGVRRVRFSDELGEGTLAH